jgi:hypothetical protein
MWHRLQVDTASRNAGTGLCFDECVCFVDLCSRLEAFLIDAIVYRDIGSCHDWDKDQK